MRPLDYVGVAEWNRLGVLYAKPDAVRHLLRLALARQAARTRRGESR